LHQAENEYVLISTSQLKVIKVSLNRKSLEQVIGDALNISAYKFIPVKPYGGIIFTQEPLERIL
jgi:hypothetical protein